MATTETLRTEFERYMDEHNVKYTVVNEAENVVLLSFSRSEDESTRVFVDFDESDNASSVHFCVQNFAKVKSQDLLPKALLIVNELNMNWRWLKFYIDVNSLEITADSDAKVFPGTVGDECTEICFRAANIIDEAFKQLDAVIEKDEGEDAPSKEELLSMLKQLMDQISNE